MWTFVHNVIVSKSILGEVMSHELLMSFARDQDRLDDDEGGEAVDRAGLGDDLATECNITPEVFRYLQTLIAGEGQVLPWATPFVRIVTGRDGWKEDFALVYGFPATDPEGDSPSSQTYATRLPEEAVRFGVYYGSNHGKVGYTRVETAQPLDPELTRRLQTGDFTDGEAGQLLEERHKLMLTYEELLIAARDPELNPDYAERVTEAFYRDADAIGL